MTKPIYQKNVEKYGFSPAQRIIIDQAKLVLIDKRKKILEIGSSSGYLTSEFKKFGAKVDVVEVDKRSISYVKKVADKVYQGSVDNFKIRKALDGNKYDLVVCADVLEHLVEPEDTLKFLETLLTPSGFFLISIPNVAAWEMRKQLMFHGSFEYQESGLLDKTHLRFYSLNNFLDLLNKLGFRIVVLLPAESRVPFELSFCRVPFLGNLFKELIKSKIVNRWPNLLVNHYVIKATP